MARKPEQISKQTWNGTVVLLPGGYTTPLTDGTPSRSETVSVDRLSDLIVDIDIDKGATVVVTPVLVVDDDTILGAPSDTGVVSDGGEAKRFIYSKISAQNAVVTVTKTEAGDSTKTNLYISGIS